jgi:hypothetical protein
LHLIFVPVVKHLFGIVIFKLSTESSTCAVKLLMNLKRNLTAAGSCSSWAAVQASCKPAAVSSIVAGLQLQLGCGFDCCSWLASQLPQASCSPTAASQAAAGLHCSWAAVQPNCSWAVGSIAAGLPPSCRKPTAVQLPQSRLQLGYTAAGLQSNPTAAGLWVRLQLACLPAAASQL